MAHYFDDFLFVGAAGSEICSQLLHCSQHLDICRDLGVFLVQDKTEGPAEIITFLGTELDARSQCSSLHGESWQGPLADTAGS